MIWVLHVHVEHKISQLAISRETCPAFHSQLLGRKLDIDKKVEPVASRGEFVVLHTRVERRKKSDIR